MKNFRVNRRNLSQFLLLGKILVGKGKETGTGGTQNLRRGRRSGSAAAAFEVGPAFGVLKILGRFSCPFFNIRLLNPKS